MRALDLSDTLRADYPQPQCPVCGRFASRDSGGTWQFACAWWSGDGWTHE